MLLRPGIGEERPVGTRLLDHADVQGVPFGIALRRLCVAVNDSGQDRGRIGVGSRDSVEASEDGDGADGNPEAKLHAQLGQHTVV